MGKMERKSLPKEKFSAFERIFAKDGDIVEHDEQEIQNLCGNFLNLQLRILYKVNIEQCQFGYGITLTMGQNQLNFWPSLCVT